MPVSLDVRSRLDVAAAEGAARQAKSLFLNAGNDISRSWSGTFSKMFDSLDGSAARATLSSLQDEYAKTAAAEQDAARVMVKANNEIEVSTRRLTEVTARHGAESSQAARAEGLLADARARAAIATNSHVDAMVASEAATSRMATASTAAATSASSAARVFNGVGVGSLALFGGAMVATTAKAGDFQQAMTKLSASADMPANELKTVSDGILKMAGQVGYSAGELTGAMYTIQKASLQGASGAATAAEKLDVLKAAAQGASVEQVPLDEVIRGLTTTLTNFHIPAQNANAVMSQLVTAVGESKVPLDQFTGALDKIEPAAAAAKISAADLWGTLSQITQSGTTADQGGDWIANATRSLTNIQGPARDAMNQLGINVQDVTDKLGDGPGGRGLAGTMQYLSDTAMSHFADANHVQVGELRNAAQAQTNANEMIAAMSPAAQQAAQALQNGTMTHRDYQMAVRKSNEADAEKLKQFQQLEDRVDGFGKAFANGQSTLQSYMQVMNPLTGTQSGAQIAFSLTGDHAQDTNDRIAKIGKTTADVNGDVKGFNETQETLNAKLRDAKAAFGAAGIEMGNVFVPTLTNVASGLKSTAEFLAEHKSLGDDLVITIGAIGGAWAIAKGIMVFDTIVAGAGRMAGAFGLVKAAAVEADTAIGTGMASAAKVGESGVVTAAEAETVALNGVRTAADLAMTAAAGVGALAFGTQQASEWFNHWSDSHPQDQRRIGGPYGPLIPGRESQGGAGQDTYNPRGINPFATGALGQNNIHTVQDHRGAKYVAPASTAPDGATPPGLNPNDVPNVDLNALNNAVGGDGGAGGKKPKGQKDDPIWIAPSDPKDFRGDSDSSGLPANFGLDKGLAGLAEWSVDYVGKLGAAPIEKALKDMGIGPNGGPGGTSGLWGIGQTILHPDTARGKRGEDPSSPMYVSSVDVDRAQDALTKATQEYGPDSTEATHASQKLAATQAMVGTTGGYYDPKTGAVSGAPVPTGGNATRDKNALDIITQAKAMGLSKEATLAALGVGLQETGLGTNPATNVVQNQNGTPGITGEFQQDNSYSPNRQDPHIAAQGFLQRFVQAGGANSSNPWGVAVHGVQRPAAVGAGGYDDGTAAYLEGRQRGAALDYYDRLSGGADPSSNAWTNGGLGGPSTPGPGLGGPRGPSLGPLAPAGGAGGGGGIFAGPYGNGPKNAGGPGPLDALGPAHPIPGLNAATTGYQGTKAPLAPMATPQQSTGTGSGFGIQGGLAGMVESLPASAASAAGGAAGAFGGGAAGAMASQAIQIGIQELNRGIQYGGQVAGEAVEGIQQTLFPDMGSGGIAGKLIGGLAGAHPISSSTADQAGQGQGGYQKDKKNDDGSPKDGGQSDGQQKDGAQVDGQTAQPPGGDTTNNNSSSSSSTTIGNQFHGPVTVNKGTSLDQQMQNDMQVSGAGAGMTGVR